MLRLRIPDRQDFATRQAWLADPDFMSYNAGWDIVHPGYDRDSGCIDWPESQWEAFESSLRRPLSQHGYFFVEDGVRGEAIGHVHYLVDGETASIGFNVVPSHRGRGIGHDFLAILLEAIRENTTTTEVINEFEDERLAAVRTHRAAGFLPDTATTSAYGRPVRVWRLRLHRP